jgi:hypothetical protein
VTKRSLGRGGVTKQAKKSGGKPLDQENTLKIKELAKSFEDKQIVIMLHPPLWESKGLLEGLDMQRGSRSSKKNWIA